MTTVAATARRAVGALEGFLFEPAPSEPRDKPPERPTRPHGDERRGSGPPVILTTAIGGSGGGTSMGAAVAVAAGGGEGSASALLVDLDPGHRTRGATVLASDSARELEDRLRALGGPFEAAAARGHLCYLPLPEDEDPLATVAELVAHKLPAAAVIVHLPQELWARAIGDMRLRARSGLLRAELPADRALAALAVRELHDRGLRAKVVSDPLGRVASRRALAGVEPGGAASRRAARLARALVSSQSGQGLPLVLGAAAALIFTALVLAAIGGAITGKARAQRAADVAALSGARSMRDDFDRLFAPALLPDGSPNPRAPDEGGVPGPCRGRRPRGGADERCRGLAAAGSLPRRGVPRSAAGPGADQRRGRSRGPAGPRGLEDRATQGNPRGRERRGGSLSTRELERHADYGLGRRLLGAAGVPAGRGDASRRRRGVRPHGGRGTA